MSNIKNYIFNRKILDRLLEKDSPEALKFFSKFKDSLKEYADRIKNGKIYKFSELEFQETFLTEIFEDVLGYTYIIHADDEWNLRREQTTRLDSSKPDAIIGFGGFDKGSEADVRGVIELKSPGADLDSKQSGHANQTPVEQAFSYASKFGKNCRWVVVSNFIEIRLYNYSDQGEYETFDLREMDDNYEKFQRFYFLLHKGNLIKKDGLSRIDKLYQENTEEEEKISQKFYQEYKQLRIHLFQHIRDNNPDIEPLTALEKTQKVIDRFIFVCFCEDKGLLEDRIFRYIIEHTTPGFSKWDAVKGLFRAINKGDPNNNINKFNGGLFEDDEILDQQIKLDDEIFEEMARITDWDFDSELNVNILGHIFEKSISDIEELKAEIEGEIIDKKKGKRKKEGIYYTPDYITKYIVENAVGGWLEDRKKELNIEKLPELIDKDFESIKIKKGKIESNARIKKHLAFWESYKEKLMNIKVLDPACGSGAFLNQAFDYLYKEGQKVNENISRLQGGQMTIFDLDKHILTNNIFGVDLNSESVEITKLSMWLKTANKGKELTFLDDNIKCGNSLIDDPDIAGDKAFKWEEEFKEIMDSGGFDVVIGNPPYVRQELIDKKEKKYLQNKYCVGNGTADLYVYFYNVGIKRLKEKGYLGFITPNKWFKTKYGINLRDFIKDLNIINIFNFFELKIFQDVSTEPQIIIIKNEKNSNGFNYYPISDTSDFTSFTIKPISINKNTLKIEGWIFVDNKTDLILKKIYRNSISLKEYTNNGIEYGIKTALNKAFIIDENTKNALIQEDPKSAELIKKYISGIDIGKWSLNYTSKKYFINTYYDIDIAKYKAIFRYLLKFEDELMKRQDKGKTHFNLRACNYYDKFDVPKIIYIHTAVNHKFYYDTENYYINNSCYLISNADKFLACWLNSNIFIFIKRLVFVAYGDAFTKGRAKLDYNKMVKVPIPKIDEMQKKHFIEKANIMLSLSKLLQIERTNFQKTIKEQKGLGKFNEKLKNFQDLEYDEFKKELKKKKVQIKLGKENDEWREYFNDTKQKINNLQKQISDTDNEIDQMVYELYDLTEEEIKIIEDSIK